MIYLKDVTKENLFDIIKLHDTLTDIQKKCVAPNVVSIAQAYVNPQAWPKGIYDDQELIGFVMLALSDEDIDDADQPAYFLWRFMIRRDVQNKHYGKRVLDLLVEKARAEGQKYLYTSCDMKNPMPYQFYISYGFMDTGVTHDDEEILKLKLS